MPSGIQVQETDVLSRMKAGEPVVMVGEAEAPMDPKERDRLKDLYKEGETDAPITPDFFRSEAESFMRKNFDRLLEPMTLWDWEDANSSAQVRTMGLTGETFARMGTELHLDANGNVQGADPFSVEGDQWYFNHAATLSYMQENIRFDHGSDLGLDTVLFYPHEKIYVRPLGRYLAVNDYGMTTRMSFDEQEFHHAENPNEAVSIHEPRGFFLQMSEAMYELDERFGQITRPIRDRIDDVVLRNAGKNTFSEMEPAERELLMRVRDKQYLTAVRDHFREHPGDRELVLTGLSMQQAMDKLTMSKDEFEKITSKLGNPPWEDEYDLLTVYRTRTESIARHLGYTEGDPFEELGKFKRQGEEETSGLFRIPSGKETGTSTASFHVMEPLGFRILDHTEPYQRINFGKLSGTVRTNVGDLLAERAAIAREQPFRELFDTLKSSGPGPVAPGYIDNVALYDAIDRFGVTRIAEVIRIDSKADDLLALRQLTAMGYDTMRMPYAELKGHVEAIVKMKKRELFRYLYYRGEEAGDLPPGHFGDIAWLDAVGGQRARVFYEEGLRMQRISEDVYKLLPASPFPDELQGLHFPDPDSFEYTHWELYDLSKTGLSEETISRHIRESGNLILQVSMHAGVAKTLSGTELMNGGKTEKYPRTTIANVIRRMEEGQNIRAIVFTTDEETFAKQFIAGKAPTVDGIIATEWRPEVSLSVAEREAMLREADTLVSLHTGAASFYAEWRSFFADKFWITYLDALPFDREGILFRAEVSNQSEEILKWFKGLSNTIGTDMAGRFIQGGYGEPLQGNWHDALYWHEEFLKFSPTEAKALLTESWRDRAKIDDLKNLMGRYAPALDKDINTAPIESQRELLKRVHKIESGMDPEEMPVHVRRILEAPGFSLKVYADMNAKPEFKALLEGKLDEKQPFAPHSRMFCERPLHEALVEALGSRKTGKKGTAKDPEQLFGHLRNMLELDETKPGERKPRVQDLLVSVPEYYEDMVIRELVEQGVDIGAVIEAKLHAKSDPDGWVCGNWTDCCMEFGTNKNNNLENGYMFSPVTQYFTVSYNGRIVAQSVAVDARNARDNSDVIILDNIEIAKNFKDRLSPVIARAYRIFWSEYTAKPVKIGTGNSDLTVPGSILEDNIYTPKQPIAYSDAKGTSIYHLPKLEKDVDMRGAIVMSNIDQREASLVDEMERMIYPPEMVQGWVRDILRWSREREVPGAYGSFIARVGRRPAGYALVLPGPSDEVPGTRAMHIWDVAVLPEFRTTACSEHMFNRILDGAAMNKLSLEMEARDSTSYRVLTSKPMRRRLERRGFFLTVDRLLPEYMDNEDFHFLRFEYRKPS